MTLHDNNYLATDADIQELTREHIRALAGLQDGRQTYLRVLIATTQKELSAKPRKRTGRPKKLNPEEQAIQLAALTTVHIRFYAVVNAIVDESLADVPAKDRVSEKNRRSNFARTALYAARLYVRSGRDLTALAPGKLSKSALTVELPPRPPTPKRLKGRVERASKAFVTALLALTEADREGAAAELDTVLGIIASQLAALDVKPARDLATAAAEHRPFVSGATLFIPTQTTVLRQRARPS